MTNGHVAMWPWACGSSSPRGSTRGRLEWSSTKLLKSKNILSIHRENWFRITVSECLKRGKTKSKLELVKIPEIIKTGPVESYDKWFIDRYITEYLSIWRIPFKTYSHRSPVQVSFTCLLYRNCINYGKVFTTVVLKYSRRWLNIPSVFIQICKCFLTWLEWFQM